jgi:ATP-dependent Lon protease
MNPIIYIDELDKVSKTEHGKEIIGILMHLIDTTQNSGFQDKYFSGIDLDLSKALFIFSYNDPAQIDKVLLDRIHRIRFDNLSLDEKKVIVKKYILPELNRKMGFSDSVILTDELIEYIIDTYTNESGVRKLKEVLFDLFGEINIELLKNTSDIANVPFVLTTELLNSRYLTKYHKVQHKLIHSTPEVGVINGLWASTNGKGGIIPIQTAWFPASSFLDLRLTGLQGDVMKESMNVAKSMAWKLLDPTAQREWLLDVAETKNQGLHIHCPEGAVSKDGPSAGTAITLAIYSLLTKRPIRNDVAITGEINLQGFITEIGGLEDKILGGVKVGIKTFLFPTSNMSDYEKFRKKYESKTELNDIRFIPVSEIHETFKWVFADETN